MMSVTKLLMRESCRKQPWQFISQPIRGNRKVFDTKVQEMTLILWCIFPMGFKRKVALHENKVFLYVNLNGSMS